MPTPEPRRDRMLRERALARIGESSESHLKRQARDRTRSNLLTEQCKLAQLFIWHLREFLGLDPYPDTLSPYATCKTTGQDVS